MFGWFKPGVRTREIVTTSINYYDSPTDLNLYWDEVLEVLTLCEEGSKENINILKEKYDFQFKSSDLYVTLVTPKLPGYTPSRSHYPGESWDFSIEKLERIYEEELEGRKKQMEWKMKKAEEEKLHELLNTNENLQKILKEQRDKNKKHQV
ncbi:MULTISPECIES: hypothetical protein [unclassified Sutcliffiella]|uniref:hypothetical protein n=1 Tax=unclassified Sutcliffiella TaxID=2837532 RepID=UPI0030D239D8